MGLSCFETAKADERTPFLFCFQRRSASRKRGIFPFFLVSLAYERNCETQRIVAEGFVVMIRQDLLY